MKDSGLMSYYIKSLFKQYSEEQQYLQKLLIQIKIFIISWFDRELNIDILYFEYQKDNIIQLYFNRILTEEEKAIIYSQLNLEYKHYYLINNTVFVYEWIWRKEQNDGG